MSPGQAHYIVLTLTRLRRKEAQRSQLPCPKSCNQLAWGLGFKLRSLIPKPILGTILLASTGTWLVSWRAGCSNITTAMIMWLSDLFANFWPWSSRVLSEAHMSDGTQQLMDHSSAFGTTIVQQGHPHPGKSTGSLLGDSRSWASWKDTFWKDKHQLLAGDLSLFA